MPQGMAMLAWPYLLNMQSKGESTSAWSSFSDILPISLPGRKSVVGPNGTDLANKMLFPSGLRGHTCCGPSALVVSVANTLFSR